MNPRIFPLKSLRRKLFSTANSLRIRYAESLAAPIISVSGTLMPTLQPVLGTGANAIIFCCFLEFTLQMPVSPPIILLAASCSPGSGLFSRFSRTTAIFQFPL